MEIGVPSGPFPTAPKIPPALPQYTTSGAANWKGVDKILSLLRKTGPSSRDATVHACLALRYFAQNDTNRTYLLMKGTVDVLFQVLKVHDTDLELQSQCVWTMGHVCQFSDEHSQLLRDCGGLDYILTTVSSTLDQIDAPPPRVGDDDQSVYDGEDASDMGDSDDGDSTADPSENVVPEHAAPFVFLLASSLRGLAAAATTSTAADYLVSRDVLPVVARALTRLPASAADVHEAAFLLVANLCAQSQSLTASIMSNSVTDLILASLKETVSTAGESEGETPEANLLLVAAGLRFIYQLACSFSNLQRLRKSRTVYIVLVIMKRFPDCDFIQLQGLICLESFCQLPENQLYLNNLNAKKFVNAAINAFPDVAVVGRRALEALSVFYPQETTAEYDD